MGEFFFSLIKLNLIIRKQGATMNNPEDTNSSASMGFTNSSKSTIYQKFTQYKTGNLNSSITIKIYCTCNLKLSKKLITTPK